jgi:GntR family transcriptional regulator
VASAPQIQQPLGALYSLFASVETAGLTQHSTVRTLDVRADAVVAERLDLEGSTPMVYLERVRYAGDEPLAVDRVWLPAAVAKPVLAADFTHTGLYRELEDRAGLVVERGREEIRAVILTPGERRLLGCGRDAAALSITRIGFSAGTPVEWRHTIVRGDRFALTAEYSAQGYRLTR